MRLAPYLLFGLALIPLSFDVGVLFGTYYELVDPSAIALRKGGDSDPLTGYWIIGNVTYLVGSFLIWGAYLSYFDDEKQSENLLPFTLVAHASATLVEVLQPILVLVSIYQVPFIVLYVLYWNAPNQSGTAFYGSIVVLCTLLYFVVRNSWKRAILGKLRIELDDAQELPAHMLSGRVVLMRQSDTPSSPLYLQLKVIENRAHRAAKNPFDVELDERVQLNELYWKIRFRTGLGVENPFQSETAFPFEVSVPAWLPRPWTRTKGDVTIGIQWFVEVVGRFAAAKVAKEFPILEIPVSLKQPQEKRIRIPQDDLGPLLEEQSILWHRSNQSRTIKIQSKRPPLIESLFFSVLFFLVSTCCLIAIIRQFDFLLLWGFLGSLVMLIAILWKQFVYHLFTIDNETNTFVTDRCFLGFSSSKAIPRDEFASVFVEPIQNNLVEGNFSSFQYDILLLFRRNHDEQLRIATVKYRLLAKAFAQAIATELDVPMEYRAANPRRT